MKMFLKAILGCALLWGVVYIFVRLIGMCFGVDITMLQATGGWFILLFLHFIKEFLK